jgi:hypothetical protein
VTTIHLGFSGYPAIKDGKPALFEGVAQIKLLEIPALPVVVLSERMRGAAIMVNRPLQRSLRWAVECITMIDIDPRQTDVERWVKGKYWHKISTLLYAKFLEERGFGERAATYRALGAIES